MSIETLPKLSTDKRSPNDPVFIGIGEIPSGRYPNRTFIGDLTEVAHRAVSDAGMTRDDIDTILLIPCLHSIADQADLIFSRMVEELGLSRKAKASMMVHSGGSTSDNAVRIASGLITSGHARNVLVLQAERWGSADLTEMVTMLTLNGIPQEWEQPSGITFNAIGAMIHKRYMEVSGSTPEDMASVCVTLRDWSNLNPNAMYRDRKLTIEEIIASKMVCDPLHAKECPMLADGGAAFVMTTAENAVKHSDSWVRINASGGCVSHYSLGQEADAATLGWKVAADRAYTHSDWGPEDADFAQIYDSYAAVTTIGLEGLGLVPKGEGARFCRAGHASPGGKLPLNTNGGLLSAGHTGVGGGMALLIEGVRQLLHRAEAPRQIENARRGIIGGSGGSYMDAQVLLLERIEKGELQ